MRSGTVKWFNPDKGFGFIKPSNGGSDLFVHHSETNGLTLNEGDPVEFEIGEGRSWSLRCQCQKNLMTTTMAVITDN